MTGSYTEHGSLSWGQAGRFAPTKAVLTARLEATSAELRFLIHHPDIERTEFVLPKSDSLVFKKRRTLLGTDLVLEHEIPDYPPVIVFTTIRYHILKPSLERLGYTITETPATRQPGTPTLKEPPASPTERDEAIEIVRGLIGLKPWHYLVFLAASAAMCAWFAAPLYISPSRLYIPMLIMAVPTVIWCAVSLPRFFKASGSSEYSRAMETIYRGRSWLLGPFLFIQPNCSVRQRHPWIRPVLWLSGLLFVAGLAAFLVWIVGAYV